MLQVRARQYLTDRSAYATRASAKSSCCHLGTREAAACFYSLPTTLKINGCKPSLQARKKKLSAELANGRLAMMAIIGMQLGKDRAFRGFQRLVALVASRDEP